MYGTIDYPRSVMYPTYFSDTGLERLRVKSLDHVEVWRALNCVLYIILSTSLSFFFDHAILFLQDLLLCMYISINFARTLCMYAMCLTSLTNSFDDRRLI